MFAVFLSVVPFLSVYYSKLLLCFINHYDKNFGLCVEPIKHLKLSWFKLIIYDIINFLRFDDIARHFIIIEKLSKNFSFCFHFECVYGFYCIGSMLGLYVELLPMILCQCAFKLHGNSGNQQYSTNSLVCTILTSIL